MSKKTLVVGASLNPDRYSNLAIQKLMKYDHEVIAYGFQEGNVNGVKIDTDMLNYIDLHTITLYLSPMRQKAYYSYFVSLEPSRVIFNPGTENPELYKILDENSIQYEIACTLVLLSTNQY